MTTAPNIYAAKNKTRLQSGAQAVSLVHKGDFPNIDKSAAKFLVENAPAIEAELCGRSLSEFVARAWPIIEPGTEYLSNWHIDLICEYLTAVARRDIKRLAIMIPPRYMKSTLVSVMWPCWIWTHEPAARFLFASHSDRLSTKHSLDRRAIISSPWYQERWGDKVTLAPDNNQKTEYTDTATGVMRAMSVGAGVTGLGGNYLVPDDLVSSMHGDSEAYREAANTFFDRSFYGRLDDKKNGVVVVIMQRLHTQDLIGHIQATCAKDGWTFLKIPAEAEKDETIVFPISGRVIERKEGDLLWPEREGPAELAAERERLGSYGYSAQYQQNPVPREGALAQRSWFKIVPAAPAGIKQLIRYWDLAATEPKPSKDPDYTASCLGGMLDGVFYILHMTNDRMSPMHVQELVKQCAQLDTEYASSTKSHVATWMEQEPGSGGPNTIDNYARMVLPGYDFHGNRATGNKFERGAAFLAAAEAGNVCLVAAPWNEPFLDEMAVLGVGAHEDLYDAGNGSFTQANAQRQSHGGRNV
jgi:predicted phage terminase large subunit-like protein